MRAGELVENDEDQRVLEKVVVEGGKNCAQNSGAKRRFSINVSIMAISREGMVRLHRPGFSNSCLRRPMCLCG